VGSLADRDLRRLAGFVAEAGAAARTGADQLIEHIVRELPTLVGCDSAMYARFEPSTRRTTTIATDQRLVDIRTQNPEAWWHLLGEHPIVTYRADSADGGAVRFSDFLTRRQLRSREIYWLFFHPFEAEYVMGVEFCRSPSEFIHIGCTRSEGDFSERQRLSLDLLRPHLARLFRKLGSDDGGIGALKGLGLSRREAEILACVASGSSVRGIAQTFYLAPSTVRKHIERIYAKLGVHTRTEASGLVLTVWGELSSNSAKDRLLAATITNADRLVLGLTRREAEVVQLLAHGLTNAQIAALLGIAPGTVKKHLDNVYSELGAHSRAEAVIRLLAP
jgi:DNA-binding NarL/FixJ family response regulator